MGRKEHLKEASNDLMEQAFEDYGASHAMEVYQDAPKLSTNGRRGRKWYSFDAKGLVIDRDKTVTHADFENLFMHLKTIHTAIWWIIGDAAVYYEDLFHTREDLYEYIAELFDKEPATIEEYVYVCRNVGMSARAETLGIKHHKLTVGCSEYQQIDLLSYANRYELSVSEFRQLLKKGTIKDKPPRTRYDKDFNRLAKMTKRERTLEIAYLRKLIADAEKM